MLFLILCHDKSGLTVFITCKISAKKEKNWFQFPEKFHFGRTGPMGKERRKKAPVPKGSWREFFPPQYVCTFFHSLQLNNDKNSNFFCQFCLIDSAANILCNTHLSSRIGIMRGRFHMEDEDPDLGDKKIYNYLNK